MIQIKISGSDEEIYLSTFCYIPRCGEIIQYKNTSFKIIKIVNHLTYTYKDNNQFEIGLITIYLEQESDV